MIVTQTPPPSKYWSEDQKRWYLSCLENKNCTLAYYLTTKDNLPLHSPNKKGWKVSPGLLQTVEPNINGKIIPCSEYALHASLDISPWLTMNCKIWVVGMINAIDTSDKICALSRKIIGTYDPRELSNELQLIAYPKFKLNQREKCFEGISLSEILISDQNKFENIDFYNSDFRNCEFNNVDFIKCDLSHVQFIKCEFANCSFTNCKTDSLYMYENSRVYNHKIVGKLYNMYWYSKTVPDGFFEVQNNLLVRSKKGKKNA